MRYGDDFMSKKIDMTGWKMWEHGQPKSRWEVIEEDFNYKKEYNIKSSAIYWKCKCQCNTFKIVSGNSLRNGTSLSCGCLLKETNSKNITGLKFNRLLALESTHKASHNGSIIWKCLCDCGNIHYANLNDLVCGNIKSCGCLQKENARLVNVKDLLGQRFTKLLVIKDLHKNNAQGANIWLCECDCGNLCEAASIDLLRGDKKSCGCLKSTGELIILQILRENNISFEYQKIFLNCKDKKPLPFDFYINNKFLLEFDGKQHYEYYSTGWYNEENFKIIKKHDEIKNYYCKINNIPLKRIPYWELENLSIEDIMGDKFLINNL